MWSEIAGVVVVGVVEVVAKGPTVTRVKLKKVPGSERRHHLTGYVVTIPSGYLKVPPFVCRYV